MDYRYIPRRFQPIATIKHGPVIYIHICTRNLYKDTSNIY